MSCKDAFLPNFMLVSGFELFLGYFVGLSTPLTYLEKATEDTVS